MYICFLLWINLIILNITNFSRENGVEYIMYTLTYDDLEWKIVYQFIICYVMISFVKTILTYVPIIVDLQNSIYERTLSNE